MKNPLDPYRNGSNNKQKMCLKTEILLLDVVTGVLVLPHDCRLNVCGSDWRKAIHDRSSEMFKVIYLKGEMF